ncbi:MAG TPA: hypothetical protein PK161_07890, partial [Candidatus Cloacimonadota bacterium]|nr:hypothetical protein [Candidatus Cloacimonadota bacterium]
WAGNKPALTTAWKAMLQKLTERFGVLFACANNLVPQNYKAKWTSVDCFGVLFAWVNYHLSQNHLAKWTSVDCFGVLFAFVNYHLSQNHLAKWTSVSDISEVRNSIR